MRQDELRAGARALAAAAQARDPNRVGDGISMGASNYLGLRSELEQAGDSVAAEAPWRHGLATVAAFVIVGAAPLLAFPVSAWTGARVFPMAIVFAALALAGAGLVRARCVGKTAGRSALEMLAVGVLARRRGLSHGPARVLVAPLIGRDDEAVRGARGHGLMATFMTPSRWCAKRS